jgi:amidase
VTARPPDRDDLRRCADALGLEVSDDDLAVYEPFVAAFVSSVGELESLTPPAPAPAGDRASWRPSNDDNPLGAWYRRCSVRGTGDGPLAGRRQR